MLKLIDQARIFKPEIGARFLLNRYHARTLIARATAESLAEHDPPLLAHHVGQRVVFADAMQTGRLVSEIDPESAAAREITALAAEIEPLRSRRPPSPGRVSPPGPVRPHPGSTARRAPPPPPPRRPRTPAPHRPSNAPTHCAHAHHYR